MRATDDGRTVTLAGWVARRRDHGGVIFVDLRDASGTVQVVFREGAMAEQAHRLRNEFCVAVTGAVSLRPEGNENPDVPTGAVEVLADELVVLSESAPLPFQIDDHVEVGEETRLKYRYLDLRRSGPAAALRLRSDGQQGRPHRPGRPRFRRDRDPDADPLHARRGPATSSCRPGSSPAPGTPCRSRRSCSSSC